MSQKEVVENDESGNDVTTQTFFGTNEQKRTITTDFPFHFKPEMMTVEQKNSLIYELFRMLLVAKEENKESIDTLGFKNNTGQRFLPFGPENMTDEQKTSIVELFRMLHPYVMTEVQDDDVPCLTAKELKTFAMQDSRFLTRCLFALATGQPPLEDAQKKNPYWQAQMYVSFGASELLMRPCVRKPGYLQRFFSDQLSITPTTHNFKQICSFLRISGSPDFLRITNSEEVLGSILKGIEYPTEDQLKEVGFYSETQDKRISRVPISMKKLCDEAANLGCDPADAVVGLQSDDYKLLTTYVLTHIQTALELKLPGQRECEFMDSDGSYGTWVKHCKIPMNLGLKLPEGSNQKSTKNKAFRIPRLFAPHDSDDIADDENEADALEQDNVTSNNLIVSEEYKTLYERNKAFIDFPLHDDLAKIEVVRGLMDYAIRANKNVKESIAGIDSEEDEELPVKSIMIPMCGDGSPVETSHRIKDVDRSTGKNIYELVHFFPGGFHMFLETLRMHGRMFEDVLGIFVKNWRPTAGKMQWIIEPSDPNDALLEYPQYILAHYRCASDCLSEINGCTELSPVQVNEHMLERAKSSPFVMAVLMELRFAEITLIFRDSEKSGDHGDVDAFLSGVRFALVLFTVTHAIKYVRICSKFLKWWATSSDAEKVLFRNFIFTRLSPHGKPIWTDRGMEWSMEHLRGFVGKHKHQGQDTLMQTVCARMTSLISKQNGVKDMRELDASSKHAPWNEKMQPLSNVFVKTYLHCKKLNLYVTGPINIASNGSLDSENACEFLRMPSGADLNATMLKCVSIGKQRAKDYFRKFYIDSENIVLRTESEMGLDLVHGSARRVKEGLQKRLIQATSTDSREIHATCTKKHLMGELKKLQDKWPMAPIPCVNLSLLKKDDLVVALCNVRAHYFQQCPRAKQQEMDAIMSAHEGASASLRHEREIELGDMFYQLEHSVSLKFENAIRIAKA